MKRVSLTGCVVIGCLLVPSAALARKSITVAMWLEGQPLKETKQIIDAYSKKTGIDVKLMATPWGAYLDKVLALAAAGKVPDVIVAERRFLPTFAKRGLLRPLDDMIKADGFSPKTELTSWRSAYYEGKFYGFPIEGGPHLLTYNPALFNKAGVQDPYTLMKAGRWTWSDFVEVGQKLTVDTNGDGKPDQFGLSGIYNGYADWTAKIRQAGGEVIDENYKKALIDQSDAVAGITFWRDLAYRYNIAPKASQGGYMAMSSGKAGMWYNWTSLAVEEKQSYKGKIDLQVALQPAGKAGYAVIAGANPIAVSKSTKNPKEAYQFAKWFAMESTFWKVIGAPASKSVYQNEYQTFLGTYLKNPDVAAMGVQYGKPEPVIHPRYRLLEDAMMPVMARVFADKLSPADAAKTMAASINRILAMK